VPNALKSLERKRRKSRSFGTLVTRVPTHGVFALPVKKRLDVRPIK